jgi:hypothetical protein
MENDDQEIRLPCPRCGKRLADIKGHTCGGIAGDASIQMMCPGSCGPVWVSILDIEKILAKDHGVRYERISKGRIVTIKRGKMK